MRFSSFLTDVTHDEEEININATTVEELIEKLVAKYGNDFEERLINKNTGKVHGYMGILVNGKTVLHTRPSALKMQLKDNDEIFIVPALHGGSI